MLIIRHEIRVGPARLPPDCSGTPRACPGGNVPELALNNASTPAPFIETNLARTPLAAFQCPSDPMGGINADLNDYGKSNYVACAGELYEPGSTEVNRGAFYRNTSTRMRDVTDGTSNTIFAGERRTQGAQIGSLWIGSLMSGTNATITSAGRRVAVIAGPTNTNAIYRINSTDWGAFSSMHTGGALFLMGDGTVRFISENVNGNTWLWLGGIADGETVGEF